MCCELLRHLGRKAIPIYGKRPAGRQLMAVGRPHDQRTRPAQLFMEEAHGIAFPVVGSKGIGADEFGAAICPVRLGHPDRPHLMQDHCDATVGSLPGSFGTGESAPDDVEDRFSHRPLYPG